MDFFLRKAKENSHPFFLLYRHLTKFYMHIVFFFLFYKIFHYCICFFFCFILDPPEITVERPIVYSGESQEAMLVCIVHGEAPPEVRKIQNCIILTYLQNSKNRINFFLSFIFILMYHQENFILFVSFL